MESEQRRPQDAIERQMSRQGRNRVLLVYIHKAEHIAAKKRSCPRLSLSNIAKAVPVLVAATFIVTRWKIEIYDMLYIKKIAALRFKRILLS